jgi:3-oxoacyl-(acyl-carrier-protein) synthase
MRYRAAIVGCAATTALGADLDATWAALEAGTSAVRPWPDAAGWEGRPPWVARRPDSGAEDEDDPVQRVLGPHGRWLDLCARAAHEAARLREVPREQVGLFVGLGLVDSPPEDLAPAVVASRGPDGAFDLARFYEGGFRTIHPLWPLAMLANVAAGHVAIDLDVRGDNAVLGGEADAGARAIGEAWRALAFGAARAALAGGASEPVTEASLVRRDLRRELARGPELDGAAGLPPGEGAAMLALEDPASARARGTAVLGYVAGHGDAFRSAEEAAERALAAAGITREDVDLVFGDGLLPEGAAGLPRTGTGSGFPSSWASPRRAPVFVSAVRGLGHLGPATAPLDVALALRSLAAGAPPERSSLAGRPVPPRRRPERALVLARSHEGATSALVVEGPTCAS